MDGRIGAPAAGLTLAAEGPHAVLDRMRELVASVWGEGSVRAIAVGVPGPTDHIAACCWWGRTCPAGEVDLKQQIGAHFATPVFVGNDANLNRPGRTPLRRRRRLSAYGVHNAQHRHRHRRDHRRAHAVGAHGVGGGNRPTTINMSADSPENNLVGTLEGMTSGPNFTRRARWRLRAGAISRAVELAGGHIEAVTPGGIEPRQRERAMHLRLNSTA